MIKGESKELVLSVEKAIENGGIFKHTVLDNGGEPFEFLISVSNDGKFLDVDLVIRESNEIFHQLQADVVWLGSGQYNDTQDLSYEHFKCNSVLFVKGSTCTWLGAECLQFELEAEEEVIRFVSTVGNSCVPYGWIETNTSYLGLISFSCETYRARKTPELELLIQNEKFYLDCPDSFNSEHSKFLEPLEVKALP